MSLNELKKRVCEISYKYKLSHLGSNLSSLEIIDLIYSQMKKDDIFILSSGHAALALYAVLEKYRNIDAEYLYNKHGCHPHRDESNYIHCSTGSLGMGLTVAVGRAMASPEREIHCLVSDGECAEGSIWEALQCIYQNNLKNIRVHINVNGYCAYDKINITYLIKRLKCFLPDIVIHHTTVEQFSFLKGLNAHYHIMSKDDYFNSLKELGYEKNIFGTSL